MQDYDFHQLSFSVIDQLSPQSFETITRSYYEGKNGISIPQQVNIMVGIIIFVALRIAFSKCSYWQSRLQLKLQLLCVAIAAIQYTCTLSRSKCRNCSTSSGGCCCCWSDTGHNTRPGSTYSTADRLSRHHRFHTVTFVTLYEQQRCSLMHRRSSEREGGVRLSM